MSVRRATAVPRQVRIERVSSSYELNRVLNEGHRVVVYHSSCAPLSPGQLLGSANKTSCLQREQTLEKYRSDEVPSLPSRLGAIFGACSPVDALHFRPGGIVYEIELVLKENSSDEHNFAACILDTQYFERISDALGLGVECPDAVTYDCDDLYLTVLLKGYWGSHSYSRRGFDGVPEILIDPKLVTIKVMRAFSIEALAEDIVAMACDRAGARIFDPYEFDRQFEGIKRDFSEPEGTESFVGIYKAHNWGDIRTQSIRKIVFDMIPLLDAPISIGDIGFELYNKRSKFRTAETLRQYMAIEGVFSNQEKASIVESIEKAEIKFCLQAHEIILQYIEDNLDQIDFDWVLSLSHNYKEACKMAEANMDERKIRECLRKKATAEIEKMGSISERIESLDRYGPEHVMSFMSLLLVAIELSGQSLSTKSQGAIVKKLGYFKQIGYGGAADLLKRYENLFASSCSLNLLTKQP